MFLNGINPCFFHFFLFFEAVVIGRGGWEIFFILDSLRRRVGYGNSSLWENAPRNTPSYFKKRFGNWITSNFDIFSKFRISYGNMHSGTRLATQKKDLKIESPRI